MPELLGATIGAAIVAYVCHAAGILPDMLATLARFIGG